MITWRLNPNPTSSIASPWRTSLDRLAVVRHDRGRPRGDRGTERLQVRLERAPRRPGPSRTGSAGPPRRAAAHRPGSAWSSPPPRTARGSPRAQVGANQLAREAGVLPEGAHLPGHRGSVARSIVGCRAAVRPTARYSRRTMSPYRSTRSGSRTAASPICSGHCEKPREANETPWCSRNACRGSDDRLTGMPSRVPAASSCIRLAQRAATGPGGWWTFRCVMWVSTIRSWALNLGPATIPRSSPSGPAAMLLCTIWPAFSSSVMRPSRSVTRSATGSRGSSCGSMVPLWFRSRTCSCHSSRTGLLSMGWGVVVDAGSPRVGDGPVAAPAGVRRRRLHQEPVAWIPATYLATSSRIFSSYGPHSGRVPGPTYGSSR